MYVELTDPSRCHSSKACVLLQGMGLVRSMGME